MPDVNYENAGTFRTDLHSSAHRNGPYDTEGFRKDVSSLGRIALRAEPTWADSGLPSSNKSHENNGAIPDGRRNTSGRGGSYGNTLRTARGRGDLEGPNFNIAVPPNGYAWWYVDGISDTTERAISIIGFIGSVFSPWYRWSGRKNPENHVCINVATYGPGGRFTMTDRGQSALRQSPSTLQVGPSSMRWNGDHLIIDVNEIGSPPLISRVKGQIIVTPSAVTDVELPLTTDGAHIWRPFAPTSRISVDLNSKGWQWEGHGYFDANFGTRALEEDFSYWTWGRYPTQGGSTCFYDATRLNGSKLAAAVQFDEKGHASEMPLPPKARLKRSLWAVARETRADAGYQPRQVKNMLDAPFYSRSAVKTQLDGVETVGVHEALDLVRFRNPLLKPMLAVRVPRRARWRFS
jgi:carotenoid 1,2-hydratase